jgi:Domain of unknown function (DUF6265)
MGMKYQMPRVLLLAVMIPAALLGADPKKSGQTAPAPAIARLSWLAGHWRMEKNGRVIDEQWMAPAAGVMLGMSRTIAKGRVLTHEFMQIREGPGGMLFFVAQPAGQAEGTFQHVSLTADEVVFENPLHDFPRRISYARQPDGGLLAFIEGPEADGTTKRIEFAYGRVQP